MPYHADSYHRAVKLSSSLYPSVIFKQTIPSPYSKTSLVDLESALINLGLPETEKKLKCPETRNMVDPLSILQKAGLLTDLTFEFSTTPFWRELVIDSKWTRHTTSPSTYSFQFIENSQIKDQQVFSLLKSVLGDSNDISVIKNAYAVSNMILTDSFEGKIETLEKEIIISKRLLKQPDWPQLEESSRRTRFFEHFNNKLGAVWGGIKILGLLQGTQESRGWEILEKGYSTNYLTPDAFFGRGYCFTSSLEYASKGAEKDKTDKGIPLLVSAVYCGQIFPVVEQPFNRNKDGSIEYSFGKPVLNKRGYCDKNVRQSYHSHATLVTKDDILNPVPISGNFDASLHTDKVVIFNETQILPLFLVYV